MARVLLDSSVWVSFFTKEDVNHKLAVGILREIFSVQNTIIIPNLVLCETLNVSYRIKPDPVYYATLRTKIKKLEPIVTVVAAGKDFWLEFAPSEMPNVNLKTSDAIVYSYVKFFHIEEFRSFDKQLEKRVAHLGVSTE